MRQTRIKQKLERNYWLQATLNSYSLIFFSKNNLFALSIFLVTFLDPFVGVCGFLGIVLINSLAFALGFDKNEIKLGLFGFNALFLCMSMGYEFDFNFPFVLFFMSALIILLLITAGLKGIFGSNKLPYLVLPFILTYWIVSLSAHSFEYIIFDESHVYAANTVIKEEATWLYQLNHSLDDLTIPEFIETYLKTLAGCFFQNSVLAGLVIALGLLQFSRISFSLSLLGFACAYFYYYALGADVNDLTYNLLGANFIFTAIGVGCFFIIPNTYSYLSVILISPIVLLVSLAFTKVLYTLQLKPYSLSFCLVTIGFMYALNQRLFSNFLKVVQIQYYSAEETIYKFLNSEKRFKNEHLYKLSLPFRGEWFVSQGYFGGITHLGQWGKALDFVIQDEKSNTYRIPLSAREGFGRKHFYCYDKDIIAPLDGYVYDIINTVVENDIGDMDTQNNWGNTIILNHQNGLFSQISHIKKDSFGVYVGQFLPKGSFIAKCGNSGRSPEPHIHFQLQNSPTVGEVTMEYPIGYFIERIEDQRTLKISEVPKEGTHISNITVHYLLSVVYSLLPGNILEITSKSSNKSWHWEVFTDAFNRSYIYCEKTNSYAYFKNDGTMFYFIDFEGDKSSLLFHFYLAAYRQLQGFYEDIKVEDKVPLYHFNNGIVQFFQDFFAPFYLFTKAEFSSHFSFADNHEVPQHIIANSVITTKLFNKKVKLINYEMEFKDYGLKTFTIHQKNKSDVFDIKKIK